MSEIEAQKAGIDAVVKQTQSQATSQAQDEQFKQIYDEISYKRGYGDLIPSRISDMRRAYRELGWSNEKCDAMLDRLRNEGEISLMPSATDTFTAEDIKDSLVDYRGIERHLIEWRNDVKVESSPQPKPNIDREKAKKWASIAD